MTATSHSRQLLGRMAVTCGGLGAAYRNLWSHEALARVVPDFLVLMHQVVRASVPLMEEARTAARQRGGAANAALAGYLTTHIDEEQAHDAWLLDDLETAGVPREEVIDRMPPASVAALVGAQYYWIRHHDPLALLGYIRVLEGSPPSDAHIARLQQRSGLPETAFRTYRLHGELDPDHLQELDHFIDTLPLTPSQGYLLWASATHTSDTLARCVLELQRRHVD